MKAIGITVTAAYVAVFLSAYATLGATSLNLPKPQAIVKEIGPYDLGTSFDLRKPERKVMLAEIGKFLWESFQGHIRAKVAVTRLSIEGDRTVSSHLVEPDDRRIWRINLVVEKTLVDRSELAPKQPFQETQVFYAYFLERLRPSETGTLSRKYPASEIIPADGYRLRLPSKGGKLLDEI